jgi:hypothetical protein
MIPVLIRIKGIDTTGVSRRALKEITREAHRLQALEWHRQFVKLHFEDPAKFRYGYKRRSEKYRRRKLRQGKGNTDLVFSGLTREAMLRPPLVRAFPSRARVQMAGPSYVAMRPRGKNKPNMGEEISTVTADEVRVLEKVLGGEVERGIKLKLASLQSVTITIGSH